ncbi:hypothetical protein GGR56DRAFT_662776 [Xylariaceae sp. FL0804]|nr:hypothetical protein GGR56DRAFT_662776 [Xylariaceae sp. FL0804]
MALATRQDLDVGAPPSAGSGSLTPLQLASFSGQAERQPFSSWYLGDPDARWADAAKDAYELAVETLRKELSADEYRTLWLREQNSMDDVRAALVGALKEYRTRSGESKVRKWLASCSSRVMYYGAIFDTFSQQHPEYVSLAWGAMKFLFIAVLNHEELLVEISKAVAKVADVLPRTELHSILYPTPRMREAVASLYAKVLEFTVLAVRWCREGRLRHSISAITRPFALRFQPVLEEVAERSRRVDELASAASKAEIRDLHVRIHGLNQTVLQLTQMVAVQQQQQALHNQSLFALQSEYKHMFQKGQIEDIQKTLLLESDDVPVADDSLAYCRSMRNRRRQRLPTQMPSPALALFRAWLSDPSSSLLLAQGQGVRTSALDFAADLLDAVLQRERHPVLWALPSSSSQAGGAPPPSVSGILRSLVSQALAVDPGVVSEGRHPVTAKHFKSEMGIREWFALLERCVSRLPRLLMVVDVGLIEAATESEDSESEYFKASEFIDQLSDIIGRRSIGGLKIVIVSWRFSIATSSEVSEVFGPGRQIFTDMGKKTERLMRQAKYRTMFKRRNQAFSERFRSAVQTLDP